MCVYILIFIFTLVLPLSITIAQVWMLTRYVYIFIYNIYVYTLIYIYIFIYNICIYTYIHKYTKFIHNISIGMWNVYTRINKHECACASLYIFYNSVVLKKKSKCVKRYFN